MGRKGGVTQRFPSSEHLKDGGGPRLGVFRVCEHEGVSSSSTYVFAKRLLLISCRQIIHYMNTQIQEGGNDCGLFAISTACHYIMPWGGPSWLGVSAEFDVKSPPDSSRQLQWRPYLFSLQRQQERGRKAAIVGSLLQSFAAANYQMIQCSHCTDVPKTVLKNNKAHWLCEFNFVSSSNIW